MSKQQQDKLENLLASLGPLEPRPGLEEDILNRILQEPQPITPAKRKLPGWMASATAVASFVACLIVIGNFLFQGNPAALQNAVGSTTSESKPSVVQENNAAFVQGTAPGGMEKSAALQDAKGVPAGKADSLANADSASRSLPKTELKRGLYINLAKPEVAGDEAAAKQVAEFLKPEDFKRIINELNMAGAEWTAVNNVVVTAGEPLEWISDALYIRGIRIEAPYEVSVSGNPDVLQKAIGQKGSYINELQNASRIRMTIETVGAAK